jgi:hypothetical protein
MRWSRYAAGVLRGSILLAIPLLGSCYLSTDGGELPARRLTVTSIPHLGGVWGEDQLEASADGSFVVMSMFDTRVCQGVLDQTERRLWRDIVYALDQEWEPPPSPVIDGGSFCASLDDGRSRGCLGDGGLRERASLFAHRLRLATEDCQPVEGTPSLNALVWVEGASLFGWELVWENGVLRKRRMEEYGWGDFTACPSPSADRAAALDALRDEARELMTVPGPDPWDWPAGADRLEGVSGGVHLFQLAVYVDSPRHGPRGNRLFIDAPELYRRAAEELSAACPLDPG